MRFVDEQFSNKIRCGARLCLNLNCRNDRRTMNLNTNNINVANNKQSYD